LSSPIHSGGVSPFQRVRKVVDFCGWQEKLRFPECLFDVIFEEIKSGPIGYEPRKNHLLTVSSSLRPGGSERQTVTVVGKMSTDSRLERIVLAIRSVDYEDRALFLRAVREMPLDVVHFHAAVELQIARLMAERVHVRPRVLGHDEQGRQQEEVGRPRLARSPPARRFAPGRYRFGRCRGG